MSPVVAVMFLPTVKLPAVWSSVTFAPEIEPFCVMEAFWMPTLPEALMPSTVIAPVPFLRRTEPTVFAFAASPRAMVVAAVWASVSVTAPASVTEISLAVTPASSTSAAFLTVTVFPSPVPTFKPERESLPVRAVSSSVTLLAEPESVATLLPADSSA